MPYTEFRKSYNGIKVVIPPVDFSSLTKDEAEATVRRLLTYVTGFVCHHLESSPVNGKQKATKLIQTMLLANGGINHYGEAHLGELIRRANGLDRTHFRANNEDGDFIRKAWCTHMAAEIKREFEL